MKILVATLLVCCTWAFAQIEKTIYEPMGLVETPCSPGISSIFTCATGKQENFVEGGLKLITILQGIEGADYGSNGDGTIIGTLGNLLFYYSSVDSKTMLFMTREHDR